MCFKSKGTFGNALQTHSETCFSIFKPPNETCDSFAETLIRTTEQHFQPNRTTKPHPETVSTCYEGFPHIIATGFHEGFQHVLRHMIEYILVAILVASDNMDAAAELEFDFLGADGGDAEEEAVEFDFLDIAGGDDDAQESAASDFDFLGEEDQADDAMATSKTRGAFETNVRRPWTANSQNIFIYQQISV